jgi:serine/threonine protein kinase
MDIEKVVGSGTFGVVFKATIKETGERVALKKFKLEIDPQSQGFPMQVRESLPITDRNLIHDACVADAVTVADVAMQRIVLFTAQFRKTGNCAI